MPGWWVAALAVVLVAWSFWVAISTEERALAWFLRRGRNRPGRTAAWVLLAHVAFLATWFVVGGIAYGVAGAADSRPVGGVVVLPMIAAHLPFLLYFMPERFSGYRHGRQGAERAGMSRATARALLWTGGPPAILGFAVCLGAFLAGFAR